MNKKQIINEAYENFVKTVESNRPEGYTREVLTKDEFITEIKRHNEFSERWGLKIEERELDMMERWLMAGLTPNMTEFDYCNKLCDEHNIPTKLITITYNGNQIEIYE